MGEVTLSQELRTARLPRPHVLVGYQWSHTGLRPGRKTSHNRYIRSFVSHPPRIRTCPLGHTARHIMNSLRDGSQSESALRLVPVEEKILELQQKKRDLADAILNADNRVISALTREDLEFLLS